VVSAKKYATLCSRLHGRWQSKTVAYLAAAQIYIYVPIYEYSPTLGPCMRAGLFINLLRAKSLLCDYKPTVAANDMWHKPVVSAS